MWKCKTKLQVFLEAEGKTSESFQAFFHTHSLYLKHTYIHIFSRISNSSRFYMRVSAGPIILAQFRAIREQLRVIPRNRIPIVNSNILISINGNYLNYLWYSDSEFHPLEFLQIY